MKKWTLVCLMILAGCAKGTGTGNPLNPIPADGPSSGSGTDASGRIFQQLCSSILTCHPQASFVDCINGISDLTGFAQNLGIHETPDPTVAEIVLREEEGYYVLNSSEADACELALRNGTETSCSSPVMQQAYQPDQTQPFALSVNVVGATSECNHVFGPQPLGLDREVEAFAF